MIVSSIKKKNVNQRHRITKNSFSDSVAAKDKKIHRFRIFLPGMRVNEITQLSLPSSISPYTISNLLFFTTCHITPEPLFLFTFITPLSLFCHFSFKLSIWSLPSLCLDLFAQLRAQNWGGKVHAMALLFKAFF